MTRDKTPAPAGVFSFGRPLTRRGFLEGTGLATMSALIPAAFAQSGTASEIPGKSGLLVLNDRPLNAETPAHLLDDRITPAQCMFVRNNGITPPFENLDADGWTLEIAGESCLRPQSLTVAELKSKFPVHTLQLQIECAGNGRSEYYPPTTGNQWTNGAIACPEWTGVRLADVLKHCGIADDAEYVAYEAADAHLSGDPAKQAISRGVPMSKALEKESLIAWAMNGEPLPLLHGFPLRMVCGGWPASVSGKWLKRLLVRNQVHDGEKMLGQSYRMPCKPIAPGAAVPDAEMCIIGSMPVRSLVTFPKSGISYARSAPLEVRGHAWAGDLRVSEVHTSIDFGATWQETKLERPANRLAWQHWATGIRFPQEGYYEIWARAVDEQGRSQPMVLPGWNPQGYQNNACHRIAIAVTA